MKTQVLIIGGGPSGLLLSQLLNQAGIATVILERQSKDHVLKRIRAGVLEWGTVELLRRAGVGGRLNRDGQVHEGCFLAAQNRQFRIDFKKTCGRQVMVYGQTEVTRDLYEAQEALGTQIHPEVSNVALYGLTTGKPHVAFSRDGREQCIDCDFITGCDGFHGVSRHSIPENSATSLNVFIHLGGWVCCQKQRPPRMN